MIKVIDIYDYYDKIGRNNILLSFKGDITSDLLTSILQITESKLESLSEDSRIKKKVFNVLVECLQNLYHHLDEYPVGKEQIRYAIFIIGKKGPVYLIMTGNYITNEKISPLIQHIEKINSLNKEELKILYKSILSNQKFNEKGGGGLGFMDIVRRSGQKIEYEVKKIDDKFSFFSIIIKICKIL